jgi:hypothetical protein
MNFQPLSSIFFLGLLTLCVFPAQAQDVENIPEEEPVRFTGSASINTGFYEMSGIGARRQPYNYSLRFNPTLQLYGISLPFSITLNKQGTRFSQPFNQFGMSPEYKWAELHLGYRRMSFSPFTLEGQTFAGGGVELNPGKLRFGAFYGRLDKASRTRTGNILQPQYKRMAWGGKIGVGTEEEYLDLIFFRSRDQLNSLSGASDSLRRDIPARENMVVGVSSRLNFFNDALSWKFDVAGSAYTRDIRQGKIDLEDEQVPAFLTNIYTPRTSSLFSWSGETSLTLNLDGFTLGGTYRRVNPDYRSMGVNYINDDVENITLNTSFSLWKRKLSISGRYGIQRNNLTEKQASRTNRNIGSLNMSFNPSSTFGINMQYSNFNVDQQVVRRDTIIRDSMLVNQVNHNLNVFPRLTFVSENHVHNIVLGATYQKLQDATYTGNEITNYNLNYGLTFNKLALTINTGLNYNHMSRGNFESERYGVSLSGRKRLLDNKLSVRLSGTYNVNQRNQREGFLINSSLYLSYQLGSNQSVSLNLSVIQSEMQGSDFIESRGNLGYNISF